MLPILTDILGFTSSSSPLAGSPSGISLSSILQAVAESIKSAVRDTANLQGKLDSTVAAQETEAKERAVATSLLLAQHDTMILTTTENLSVLNTTLLNRVESFDTIMANISYNMTTWTDHFNGIALELNGTIYSGLQDMSSNVSMALSAINFTMAESLAILQDSLQRNVSHLNETVMPTMETRWKSAMDELASNLSNATSALQLIQERDHAWVQDALQGEALRVDAQASHLNDSLTRDLSVLADVTRALVAAAKAEVEDYVASNASDILDVVRGINTSSSQRYAETKGVLDETVSGLRDIINNFSLANHSLTIHLSALNVSLQDQWSALASSTIHNNASINNLALKLIDMKEALMQTILQLNESSSAEIKMTHTNLSDALFELQNNVSSAVARSNAILSRVIGDINITLTSLASYTHSELANVNESVKAQVEVLGAATQKNFTDLKEAVFRELENEGNRFNGSLAHLSSKLSEEIDLLQHNYSAATLAIWSALTEEGSRRGSDVEKLSTSVSGLELVLQQNISAIAQLVAVTVNDTNDRFNTSLTQSVAHLLNMLNNQSAESRIGFSNMTELLDRAKDDILLWNESLSQRLLIASQSARQDLSNAVEILSKDLASVNTSFVLGADDMRLSLTAQLEDLRNQIELYGHTTALNMSALSGVIVDNNVWLLGNITASALATSARFDDMNSTFRHELSSLGSALNDTSSAANASLDRAIQEMLHKLQLQNDTTATFIGDVYLAMNDSLAALRSNVSAVYELTRKEVNATALLQQYLIANLTSDLQLNFSTIESRWASAAERDRLLSASSDEAIWEALNQTNQALIQSATHMEHVNASLSEYVHVLRSESFTNMTQLKAALLNDIANQSAMLDDLREGARENHVKMAADLSKYVADWHVAQNITTSSVDGLALRIDTLNSTSLSQGKEIENRLGSRLDSLSGNMSALSALVERNSADQKDSLDAMELKWRLLQDQETSSVHRLLEGNMSSVFGALHTVSSKLSAEAALAHEKAEKSIAALQANERSLQATVESNEKGVNSELSTLRAILDDINRTTSASDTALQRAISQVELTAISLNSSLSLALRSKEEKLVSEISRQRGDLQDTNGRLSAVTTRTEVVEKITDNLVAFRTAVSSQAAALENSTLLLREDLSQLRTNTALLATNTDQLKSSLADATEEVHTMMRNRLPYIESQLASLSERLLSLKETAASMTASTESRLFTAEKSILELSNRVSALEAIDAERLARLEALEAEVSRGRKEVATKEEVVFLRQQMQDMQNAMLTHSGKVLDLLTAVTVQASASRIGGG